MTRLLAGELIKVRTTRTAVGFGIVALLLALATVLIVSLAGGGPDNIEDKRAALAFGSVISAVLLVYGVVGATGEFRHRTLAPAVLIAPDHYRLVLARTVAYAFTAALAAAVIGAVVYLIGIPLLAGTDGPGLDGGDYLGVAAGGLLASTLCAALGVAVGTLVRNQVAAVVGLLAWIFVVEPLLSIPSGNFTDYTIGTSAGVLGQGGNVDGTMAHALAVLTAWTLLLSMAAAAVDRRREVD